MDSSGNSQDIHVYTDALPASGVGVGLCLWWESRKRTDICYYEKDVDALSLNNVLNRQILPVLNACICGKPENEYKNEDHEYERGVASRMAWLARIQAWACNELARPGRRGQVKLCTRCATDFDSRFGEVLESLVSWARSSGGRAMPF